MLTADRALRGAAATDYAALAVRAVESLAGQPRKDWGDKTQEYEKAVNRILRVWRDDRVRRRAEARPPCVDCRTRRASLRSPRCPECRAVHARRLHNARERKRREKWHAAGSEAKRRAAA